MKEEKDDKIYVGFGKIMLWGWSFVTKGTQKGYGISNIWWGSNM